MEFLDLEALIFAGESENKEYPGYDINQYFAEDKLLKDMNAPTVHDPVVIMYTSGTIGNPKGALLSHFNILHGIISYQRAFGLTDKDSTIIGISYFSYYRISSIDGIILMHMKC